MPAFVCLASIQLGRGFKFALPSNAADLVGASSKIRCGGGKVLLCHEMTLVAQTQRALTQVNAWLPKLSMMPHANSPHDDLRMTHRHIGNELLDRIARVDDSAASFLLGDARTISFAALQTLQAAGTPITSCYFPVDGVLALTTMVDDGIEAATSRVGFDGAVHANIACLDTTTHDVTGRLPGTLYVVSSDKWQTLVDENAAVRRIAALYAETRLWELQQSLACQMRHDVESRLCRLLLELHRWQRGKALAMTHLGLSQMLGVRRITVTLLARTLQDAGIISYRRGVIQVVDAYALQQASCRCHQRPKSLSDVESHEPAAAADHVRPPPELRLVRG